MFEEIEIPNTLINTLPTIVPLYGLVEESIVDGPGLRMSLFLQGCSHHCPGCHNADSQSFCADAPRVSYPLEKMPDEYIPDGLIEIDAPPSSISIEKLIEKYDNDPLMNGITLTGGDPMDIPFHTLAFLIAFRKEHPSDSVWIWSGYTYEQLIKDPLRNLILEFCDVLVDGPFVESKKNLMLQWRGSENQRVIDLFKTRETGEIAFVEVLDENQEDESEWEDKPWKRRGPGVIRF